VIGVEERGGVKESERWSVKSVKERETDVVTMIEIEK
jgi:hypothetical protein